MGGLKIIELLLPLAAALWLINATFHGCCANYDVLVFNFLYYFVCILIAIPFLYFFGRNVASGENVTLIVFRIMVLVVLGASLLIVLPLVFQEPNAQYFGFDTSDWTRRGIRRQFIIKPEVRSGAGLAFITWCLIGAVLLIKHRRKPIVKVKPPDVIKRDSFDRFPGGRQDR
jgi:hypothetical protein